MLRRGYEQCRAVQAANANVLMIGAGGIGCELIKTLILSGFRKVTMVRILIQARLASLIALVRLSWSRTPVPEACTTDQRHASKLQADMIILFT